jgi:hypothetical protein
MACLRRALSWQWQSVNAAGGKLVGSMRQVRSVLETVLFLGLDICGAF